MSASSMRTALSHVLPVADACELLGEATVRRIIRSFLQFRQALAQQRSSNSSNNATVIATDPQEEMAIIRALFYVRPGEGGRPTIELPKDVAAAWQRLTKRPGPLAMDKGSFLRWAVPLSSAPYAGHGGHLGLFDCLTYSLQVTPQQQQQMGGVAGGLTPVVLLPDILIFFAICRGHIALKKDHSKDSYGAMLLSVMAFRIYDSYQKRGTVTRDTLHKFMSDIYGEESYKTPQVRKMLDQLFTVPEPENDAAKIAAGSVVGRVVASLTTAQFCKGVSETLSEGSSSHVLLDWIASLGNAMLPTHDIPQSTQAYLETISSSNRSTARLCHKYGLAEGRLYEIKRRFHSMVESSNVLIQGDGQLPMTEQQGEASAGSSTPNVGDRPRHVITQDAFVKAVSTPNDEQGHGGYLPVELAQLTFMGGCPPPNPDSDSSMSYWAMYDVLLFGCQAVRTEAHKQQSVVTSERSDELPLLRFAYRVFCMLPEAGDEENNEESSSSESDRRILTRAKIGRMLLLLLQHAAFRLKADSPKSDDDFDGSNSGESGTETDKDSEDSANIEDTFEDVSAASLLGILPSTNNIVSGDGNQVKLGPLIDYVLEEAAGENEDEVPEFLTFDSFLRWHYKSTHVENSLPVDQRRVGPYILELKLVASVLFGIPPSRATLENALVEELHRRQKYRYPQTDVSRRGPRGTVWYIIDDYWYRTWLSYVQKPRDGDKDAADGRADVGSTTPRGLGKINNTGLLADNGSLALRPNIRWRQDYEIIAPLAWSALQAWYDGGPPIYRTVVPYVPRDGGKKSPHSKSELRIRTEHEIELYPFFVTVFLCDAPSRGEARPFQQYVPVSRVSPVRVLLVQLCKGLDVDPKYGRLWMMGSNPQENPSTKASHHDDEKHSDWLLNLDVNIVGQQDRNGEMVGKTGNGHSMVLLLELKDEETGKWPRGLDGRNWTFQKANRLGDDDETLTGDGIVGLYNMGNTCYLNSSVQCLSHTPVFRDYFTSKAYLNDINTTNPLGHQGRLAQVSAVLINSLWKRFNQSVVHQPKRVTAPGLYAPVTAPALTPKTFKEALGKVNDHFAGNEQHDAQELLAFLLGGLSEDLNRIVDKPYIEAPDSDGRPDSELADIWWSNHLKREMSIIVALFTGQYKSLLTCRSCKYESARFEPFSFLQLPLPEDDKISVSLILYPLRDGAETMKYSVRVRHNGRLLDVLIALAKVLQEESIASNDDQVGGLEERGADHLKEQDKDDSEEETAKKLLELEKIYQRIAQNMAVVDMRDGYIFKIAPNSWALPDLQNKDTGELPVLHIYELDPMIITENSFLPLDEEPNDAPQSGPKSSPDHDSKEDGSVEEDSVEETSGDEEGESDDERTDDTTEASDPPTEDKPDVQTVEKKIESEDSSSSEEVKYSFLALAQRMTEVVNRNQMHPFSHKVFGTPLLLRVIDLEGYSGRDLYDLVARRIRNFVPKSALRFLVDENDSNAEDGSTTSSQKHRGGSRLRRQRTTSEMEVVAAGAMPRYGFRLRIATRDGRRCALCSWYDCCIGCLVPDDDYPTIAVCGDSLVLDWHFAVDIATSGFGLRNQTEGTAVPAALRSRATSVTVKNHSSCDGAKKKGYAGAITLEDCLDSFAKEERIPEAYCSMCKDFRVQTKRMSLWRLPPVVIIQLKRFQFTQHMRRKLRDLVVFPVEGLDLSRIVAMDGKGSSDNVQMPDANGDMNHAGEETDTTDADTTEENEDGGSSPAPLMSPASLHGGRSVMLYDLYGVVHHQGALSGGHYVASLKSELDSQWRLFNDAQVYEIHSRDVVDSSAYILFYIRRDVSKSKLQDFWDISAREGEGLTEEEVEKLMKGRSDRCVIS